MDITSGLNLWTAFKEYSMQLEMPIKEFQEAFNHVGVFGYRMTKKILNYNTTCKKNYLFPIGYYAICVICTMAILRCVLNIYKIMRKHEMKTTDKKRNTLLTILTVRLGCQMIRLVTYCILLAGLINKSGALMIPWLITQSLALIIEFLDIFCCIVFRKDHQRNFRRELSFIFCWFIVIFVLSIKNFFDMIDVHVKKSLWF